MTDARSVGWLDLRLQRMIAQLNYDGVLTDGKNTIEARRMVPFRGVADPVRNEPLQPHEIVVVDQNVLAELA